MLIALMGQVCLGSCPGQGPEGPYTTFNHSEVTHGSPEAVQSRPYYDRRPATVPRPP